MVEPELTEEELAARAAFEKRAARAASEVIPQPYYPPTPAESNTGESTAPRGYPTEQLTTH
jgi:hypothetical protein